jgi:hypothetical protein
MGKVSKASDVFAFGAFILEVATVACGRKPVVQDAHANHLMLVDWVLDQ